jgi:hypothetical protein
MASTEKHSSNGASSAEHFAPIGHVMIEEHGVAIDATFVHPDITNYAESGGLGLDELGSVQALLVAGINASRSVGAYALAAEAKQATEGLRIMLGIESEALLREAFKRVLGEDGEEDGLINEIERISTEGAKAFVDEAEKLLVELKGAGDNALPQIIEKRVRQAANDTVERILGKAIADDGPLGILLANQSKRIGELRDDLSKLTELLFEAKGAAETIDPAAAGRDWQPAVIDELSRLSLVTGDRVEETGDIPGHGRSKKGDAVIHVATARPGCEPKAAVETRTGKTRVTLADLKAAKENRSADAGLLVVSDPAALPKDAEELGFRCYWDERAVVLHYDPAQPGSGILLATALQIARMFAQLNQATTGDEIKEEVVRASLQRLERCLGKLKPLRASATGIEKEVRNIRTYAQDMEKELRGAIGELSGLVGWEA